VTTHTSTATVEVLSAEVRVLMVGSRQVTLSVYRQLDSAPLTDVELFGRVRDRSDSSGDIHVIGRHQESGSLTRACLAQTLWPRFEPDFAHWWGHVKGGVTGSSFDRGGNGGVVVAQEGDIAIAWITHPMGRSCPLVPSACSIDALESTWRREASRQLSDELLKRDLRNSLAKLPLVVLAGLR